MTGVIVLVVVLAVAALLLWRSVRIVPQGKAVVVQRLGQYRKTAGTGPLVVVPFIDTLLPEMELREQVMAFERQPVVTSDHAAIRVDVVLHYHIVDPVAATYAISNVLTSLEQLTLTSLRSVLGSEPLEQALLGRSEIGARLRDVLDETSQKWGTHVTRVEIRDVIAPTAVQEALERHMQAEQQKRAAIAAAEGEQHAAVLRAQGEKQATILAAEGRRAASIIEAEGEAAALVTLEAAQAEAIGKLFSALNASRPTPEILRYLYIRALPQMAQGAGNTVVAVPPEFAELATTARVVAANGNGAAVAADGLSGASLTGDGRKTAALASDEGAGSA